jgi:hypothetical protein
MLGSYEPTICKLIPRTGKCVGYYNLIHFYFSFFVTASREVKLPGINELLEMVAAYKRVV